MNHRKAQVFRVGLPPRLAKRDVVGGSVIPRPVDGPRRYPPHAVQSHYRIAAHGHHIAQ